MDEDEKKLDGCINELVPLTNDFVNNDLEKYKRDVIDVISRHNLGPEDMIRCLYSANLIPGSLLMAKARILDVNLHGNLDHSSEVLMLGIKED